MQNFTIVFLPKANKFIATLEIKAKERLLLDLKKAQSEKNTAVFKKLKGSEIWEFRTSHNSKEYRLLSFWCPFNKSMVIAVSGFVKKTSKTPTNEIKTAEQIRILYIENNRS